MILSILLMAGVLALTFGLIGVKSHKNETRRRELRQLADASDMQFAEKDDMGLMEQLKHFDLFRREQGWMGNGQISNLMTRRVDDTEVSLFDYSYRVSTGKSTHTYTQTVFFANNKEWFLPNFRMKPETWWHKVLQRLGVGADINFPENPDFSEQFWLTGDLEALIRRQFSPELQYFFLERPPVHLEGNNFYLIAYKPKKALNPEEARTFLAHCEQLVQLLKKEDKTELLQLVQLKVEAAKG